MRALFVSLLALYTLANVAEAQIIAVHLKDEKAERKFSKYLVEVNGKRVLLGEPKQGFVYVPGSKRLSFIGEGVNELLVVDPDKPEEYAYFLVDGEKQEASKKNKLSVQGRQVERLTVFMEDQSLPGLTREYLLRTEQLDGFRAARDAAEKGSVVWLAAHNRLVTTLERLHGWLARVGFPGALKDLEKEIKQEMKSVRDDGLRARYQTALDSIASCEPPADYATLAEKISGGKDVFHGYQSQHLRIYYLTDTIRGDQDVITDEEARSVIQKGEEIIEGFRAEFVDPYLGDDYPDYIPDGVVATFAFLPENTDDFQRYAGPLYGRYLDKNYPESGYQDAGGTPVHYRNCSRLDNVDLEAIICHGLGHALSALHYGQGRTKLSQDWLTEAVGNQLSYEFLGRNDCTCYSFREVPTYTKRVVPERGEKALAFGRRAAYNQLALEQGSNIDQIALKRLYELNDGDLAKGWSFFDFIARKEGKAGQMWLRAAGQFAPERDTFIEKWRAAAATILGVDAGNAFRVLEERWRAYAETDQLKEGDEDKGR